MILDRKLLSDWSLGTGSPDVGDWLIRALCSWNNGPTEQVRYADAYPFFPPAGENLGVYLVNTIHTAVPFTAPLFAKAVGDALRRWTPAYRYLCLRDLFILAGRLGVDELADAAVRAFDEENARTEDPYKVGLAMVEFVEAVSVHPKLDLISPLADLVDRIKQSSEFWKPNYSLRILRALIRRRETLWAKTLIWLGSDVRDLMSAEPHETNDALLEIFSTLNVSVLPSGLENDVSGYEIWVLPMLFGYRQSQANYWKALYRVRQTPLGDVIITLPDEPMRRGASVLWDINRAPKHIKDEVLDRALSPKTDNDLGKAPISIGKRNGHAIDNAIAELAPDKK